MKKYVLDTSAVLTLLQDEAGTEQIVAILSEHIQNKCIAMISVLTLVELYYKFNRKYDVATADKIINNIMALQLIVQDFDQSVVAIAGQFKTTGALSFADACIGALAKNEQAILVHKDPEFAILANFIQQQILPFKPKNT